MVIAPEFGLIAFGRKQVRNRYPPIRAHLIEIGMLDATLIRVRVIEDPIVVGVGQVGVVPILGHEFNPYP